MTCLTSRKRWGYRRVVRRARRSGTHYNYFRTYDPQTGRYIESDPIGLAGGSYSTYAYVGANPISRNDPEGLALRVAYGNGATEAQWSAALAYLASSAQFTGNLATLIASPYIYTININPSGVDGYSWQSRTITWNPTSGLDIAGVGVQSPAIGFAHEASHAACHESTGTKGYRASTKVPTTTQFTNNEIVISLGVSPQEQQATLAEQLISQQLGGGDPARSNYNQPSQPITVGSPTYHLLYGP